MDKITSITPPKIIETLNDISIHMRHLVQLEPLFAKAYCETGALPLRRRKDGFVALFDAIVGQQVSVASANAISQRLKDAGMTGSRRVLEASESELRDLGLSRQKARYAKALAEARIDYVALRTIPSEDVIKTLVAVPGVGPWTAEIYAMFSLGHADVFAHGDLALQEAARVVFELEARPNEREMRVLAAKWSPHRAVAARLLWAYYRIVKQREGIR